MRRIRAAEHFPSPLTSPEAQSAWTPPPGQALVSDAASQGWARCGHSHGRQAQRGHPTLTHSEVPVAPWRSGDWHLRAVAVTADTMSPPCSDEPDLTLEEKVLDPASPGSGLVALTCVLPPSCPSLANPAHPLLRLSSPLLQEGLLAPSLQWGASGRCHLDPGWAGGVAFSPGLRLRCPSCAPCRVVQGWAQGCTPGTGTDPVQLCPQLLPLGTIQSKVWPRKSWPHPHPALPGFSHRETVFPSDPAPEGRWGFLLVGCWPSGWGSGSWYRAEHAQQALSICPSAYSRVPENQG